MTNPEPLADGERAEVLDALRGFALLGILISHVPDFSGYEFLAAHEQAALDRFGVDAVLGALSDFAIRGKFFSLFSLLFGIGFAVQLDSARRRGAPFVCRFVRRLAALCMLGVAHGFLWYGDILRDYALLGLFLLPAARWNTRKTGRVAVAWLTARLVWPILVFALAPRLTPLAGAAAHGDPTQHFRALNDAFAAADWAGTYAANLELLRLKALQLIYEGKAVSIVGMFFVGAYVGKARLYVALGENRKTLRRALAICAPVGVLGNAVLAPLHAATPDFPPTLAWLAEEMLFAVAVPALALAYASGFALLSTGRMGAGLRAFAPAGRMALSTYVSQSLLGIGLFYGVGLGLRGSVGRAECLAIALVLFAAQAAFARRWLGRFRFGPLEWCWRCATYGVRVPMRRALSAG